MVLILFTILCLLLNPGIPQQGIESLSSRTIDKRWELGFATWTRGALEGQFRYSAL